MNANRILSTTIAASALLTTVTATQAQKALRTDTITARQAAHGYILPNRKAMTNNNINLLPQRLQSYEKTLNAQGFTLANANDVWTATPNFDAAALNAQFNANQAAGTYGTQTSGTTISDTYFGSWEAGNKYILYGQALFSLTHSANRNMARLQGDAEINGAILGDSANLAKATADFYAPATGTQSASMNLTVVGQTIWSKSDTGATSASINEGFTWTGKLWQIGFDWTIAGYGIAAELWLQGSVGASFTGTCVPKDVTVGTYADANLALGAHVAADLGIVNVNFDGNLTLIDLDFLTFAETSSTQRRYVVNNHPVLLPVMNVQRNVSADLTLVKGYTKVKVTDPIFGFTLGTWNIINEPNGLYDWHGTLDDYTKTYTLP